MNSSKKIQISNVLSATGLFLAAFLLSNLGSAAEGSFEVMCRNKAKEIAAETYKGCMTENRQTQLEQIRKEYKEELSNLKNQYDKRLKKLSGGSQKNDDDVKEKDKESTSTFAPTPTIELKRTKASAARSGRLPVRHVGTGTQVIDLTKPIDSQINGSDGIQESARIEKRESSDNNEAELVELANQQ